MTSELTRDFSESVKKSYEALAQGRALADFSSCGKIKVAGKDRIEFLHNILTNDIKRLAPGQNCLAALLHATGKTLSFMEVHVFEDHVLLLTESGFEEKTLALLDRYLITEDVGLKNVTAEYAFLISLKDMGAGNLRSDFFFKNTRAFLWKAEEKAEKIKSFSLAEYNAYEMLRIESGIPRYGKDFDETVILSETGLDKTAVSTTKGCYPGQEVIAKIETYDGLQRKLRAFSYEGKACPPLGTKILMKDGQEAGELRSVIFSPRLGRNLGLGYLSRRCPADAAIYFNIEGKVTELRREETILR